VTRFITSYASSLMAGDAFAVQATQHSDMITDANQLFRTMLISPNRVTYILS